MQLPVKVKECVIVHPGSMRVYCPSHLLFVCPLFCFNCLLFRVLRIPNFTNSYTGICELSRYRYQCHVSHVIDIHLNSGSGVVKCMQLSVLQNLEQASSAAFTEKCCQISLFTCLAISRSRKMSTLDSLDNAIHFYSSLDTNPLYFLTALVSAPIPIPVSVSVEAYFYLT